MFLPHFSTKDRGTGLGLAIAARIIAEHGGTIRVEDNHPVGSRFLIELPVAEAAPSPPPTIRTASRRRNRSFPMSANPHILIVDDEAGIRESLSSILQDEGYLVEAVGSAEEALERVSSGELEVILLDVWLPGMDGLEALSRIQSLHASARGHHDLRPRHHRNRRARHQARRLRFHRKAALPRKNHSSCVRNAIQQRRLRGRKPDSSAIELGHRYQVIGDSVPMKALRQQIAVTAPTNGRVLIYGESGTGKELVARALHAASLRSKGAFVEVNCAAIPEELIESELFGHVKGSFTGATEDKIGKFEKADGGTLFLDEVGDMSLRTQSKVLRVLEEQRFEPVGSNQTITRGCPRHRRHQQKSRTGNRPRRISARTSSTAST